MQPHIAQLAQRVLAGELLDRDDARTLSRTSGQDIYDLFYWANKIRVHFMGPDVKFCAIVAAKVGGCSEDCKFCAQSAHHDGPAKEQSQLTDEDVLKSAVHAAEVGADSFGIVNSGRGPTRRELEDWLKPIMMKIAQDGKTRACATLGALTPETAKFLYDCGIRRINHNLETSERHYPNIVSTHPFSERVNTLKIAKEAGLSLCSGGIFGMGEDWEDRLDMMFTLRDLGVDVMPINFLNAIHGTPLANQPKLPPMECLKIVAIARFVLPTAELKVAGGREVCLRDLQSWIFFAGADSTMIGNYLTTYGRKPEADHQMVMDLGLMWRTYDGGAVNPTSDDPKLSNVSHTGQHRIPILYERELATTAPEALFTVRAIDVTPQAIITGTGLITPLGRSVESTWQALLAGRFILDHARVDPEINDGRPRVTQLASTAAREAIASAGWDDAILADDRTALIVGTSKGPIEDWINSASLGKGVQRTACGSAPAACGFANQTTSHNTIGLHQIAESLASEFKLGSAPRLTLSAACASGLHALIRAAMLIQSGEADRVLVVAAEASVHPLFVSSFKRLGVLPPKDFGCRPFDQNRAGFLMSEAAAALCLENSFSRRACSPSVGVIHPQISRFALGSDATHLTGINPSAKTLSRLLRHTINDTQIDLIHAHGTGTVMNDPIELAAINDCLSPSPLHPLHVYSHKGALGHTLGAAGLISIVLNVESHRRGIVPPNIQTRHPLDVSRAILSRQPQQTPIRRSLAIATGFGGPTAVISLENP